MKPNSFLVSETLRDIVALHTSEDSTHQTTEDDAISLLTTYSSSKSTVEIYN